MIKYYLIFLFPLFSFGQYNCNVFLSKKDTLQYKACKLCEENENRYSQFDWRQIQIWEKAIDICPYFAYPYREISSTYIKSGNFIEWKKYMDKAVEYDPLGYLDVRASLRYKFFADYHGTLEDIASFEKLTKGSDIGYTSNGMYHLNIVKGLCLKAIGDPEKAIKTIEAQLHHKDHFLGLYDYIHLGVLYLEKGRLIDAEQIFLKQIKENDIAENRYYLAITYKKMNNEKLFKENILKSSELFKNDLKMNDPYSELFDQIYLVQIEKEIYELKVTNE